MNSPGQNCLFSFSGDLLRPEEGEGAAGCLDTPANLQLPGFVLGSLSGAA